MAPIGSFELLMLLVRTANHRITEAGDTASSDYRVPAPGPTEPQLGEAVHALHRSGTSQRAIARELNIDRRKVKRLLDRAA